MFNIVLYQPEIPPNTGNIIRLCANTGCRLHLVEPMGFDLDDSKLRRAGLDYHEWAEVRVHADLASACRGAGRIYAVSTRGKRRYTDVRLHEGDTLVFGPETRGLPADYLGSMDADRILRIPRLPLRPVAHPLHRHGEPDGPDPAGLPGPLSSGNSRIPLRSIRPTAIPQWIFSQAMSALHRADESPRTAPCAPAR